MSYPSVSIVERAGTAGITVEGLTKRFGSVTAVEGLSFTVEPGVVTGFLGPNGAGKTTTLRMLLGLVSPDAGRACIGGQAYAAFSAPGDVVGAVLEATGFHPARSGRSHLRVYCTVNGYPLDRADEVLDLVGLSDAARRAVRGYSLGMRQRLALAAALLGDPEVLVLDEPANGLDPQGIAWMRGLLREFVAHGRTVLVSSHVLSEVQQLVDQVVIVNKGRLVWSGTLTDLPGSDGHVVLVQTPHSDDLVRALAGARLARTRVDRVGRDRLRITGIAAAEVGRIACAERVELHELTPGHDGLEEVFLALTAGPETASEPGRLEAR